MFSKYIVAFALNLRACETIANSSGHILTTCSLDRQTDILRLEMNGKINIED